ncbi:MAG: hypothetical protein Q8K26_04490, partial [Candidatus Gracilibacteria bacterium]|nr:hypothetical protein [Candidatus Gracilibacteria bacterium]
MKYTHILLTLTIIYITLLISNVNAACTTEPVMTQEGNDVRVTGTRTVCTPETGTTDTNGFNLNAPVGEVGSQYQYTLPPQGGTATSGDNSLGSATEGGGDGGGGTTVMVTEEIPGMYCTKEGTGTGPESKKYKC